LCLQKYTPEENANEYFNIIHCHTLASLIHRNIPLLFTLSFVLKKLSISSYYMKSCAVILIAVIFSSLQALSQCPTLGQNATFTSDDCQPGSNPCALCPGDQYILTPTGTNLQAGDCINWYINTVPNFNPYNGQGTLIGCSELTSPPPNPCNPNPIFLGMMVNACGTEENNEFIGLWSGGGFYVSDLMVTYNDSNNNGCGWQTPSGALQASISAECPGAVFVGAGEIVPANVPVVVFTSSSADFDYNFSGLCATNGTFYVLQSDCSPSPDVFPNSGTGSVTTGVSIGCWSEDITYNLSQINNTNGAFVAEIPILGTIYGVAGCGWPSFPGLPGTDPIVNIEPLEVTVTADQCNNGPYYIIGIYEPLPNNCPQTFTNTLSYDVPCPSPVLGTADLCSNVSNYNLVQLQDPGVPDGTWSGDGVTGTTFNANGLSGPIELTFTPTSPCGTVATTIINVSEAATAMIEPVIPVCVGGSTTLTINFTGTPSWSFNLLGNGSLLSSYSADATPYSITITPQINTNYVVQSLVDGAGCTGLNTSILVPVSLSAPSAVLSLVGNDTICSGTAAQLSVDFSNGTPPYSFVYAINGTSQAPITNISQDPYNFPVTINNNANITLVSVSDMNGCTGNVSGSAMIRVLPAPTATLFSDTTTICAGATDTLKFNFTGNPPFTFIYKIDTVNQMPITTNLNQYQIIVSPTSGPVVYTLVSVQDSLCPGMVSGIRRINVIPAPTALISGADTICAGQTSNLTFNFTGSPPYTLNYTANGVPQATIVTLTSPFVLQVSPDTTTTYVITNFNSSECPGLGSGTAMITVNPPPTAVISGGGQICQGGTGTTFTVNFTGVGPFTFVYSANNVNQPPITTSNNPYVMSVNPSSGTGYRLVSVSDARCSGTVAGLAQVFVFVPASATLSGDATFCDSAATTIMVDFNGSGPFTIEYTIDGVPQPLVYTPEDPYFIDVNVSTTTVYALTLVESPGCTGIPSGTATITVNYPPSYANQSVNCNLAQGNYTVTFTVLNGEPPYTLLTGSGTFTGNQFTSNPIPLGTNYNFIFHDNNDCGDIVVSGQESCNCSSAAGSVQLAPLNVCITSTATATYTGGFVDDGNDLLLYILHSTPALPLGTIYAWNNTPSFGFQPGMSLGTTYYISPIAGNPDGTGLIDLADVCLSVSQGTPVVFRAQPTASIANGMETICLGDSAIINITLNGTPNFSFTPAFNGVPQSTVAGISGASYPFVVYPQQNTQVTIASVSDQLCAMGNTSGAYDIQVAQPAAFGPVTTTCNYANSTYTISFPVTGTPPYNIAGLLASFNGTAFVSSPIPFGTPYLAYLWDANNCTPDTLSGLGVCACISDAGTMSQIQVNACQDDTLTVPPTMGEVVAPGAVLMYIMHTMPGIPLGTILAWSNTPSFVFASPMMPNVTYYISAIVGNPNGMGQIDLNDPCLEVATGTPVRWRPVPTANLTNGTFDICPGGAQALIVSLTGTPNYTLTYTSNASVFNVNPTQNLFSINAQLQQTAVITLTGVVDAHGCVGTVSGQATVNVHPVPVAINLATACNFATQTYVLDFDVINADLGTVNIANIAGTYNPSTGHFTSDPIPSLQPYNFTITDSWGCGNFTAMAVVDCSCVTSAGSMTNGSLILCPGQTATTAAATGVNLEPGDVLMYYLVDTPSPSTWTILASNTSPDFVFNPSTMMYETTYYIVAAAGNMGPGGIDFNDPCLSSAPGPTVVWRTPITATLSGLDTICIGSTANLNVVFTGSGPFFFTYTDGGVNQVVSNIAQNPYSLPVTPSQSSNYTLVGISGAGTCIGTVSGAATIQVNQLPQVLDLMEICDLTTETYTLTFDVSNGPAPNSNYSISGIAGSFMDTTFTSLPRPGAQPYQVTISDNIGCSAVVSGQPACVCTSSAGTLSNIQNACLPNGMVSAQSNGNSSLDTNDVVRYFLCSDPAMLPSGIFAESNTPQFAFQPGMVAGTTYFIVLGVGNPLPNGNLDFMEPCYSLSAGFPVVFHAVPTAAISGSATICPGQNASVNIQFTGNPPFKFNYAINGVPQPQLTIATNTFTISSNNIQSDQVFTMTAMQDANCTGTFSGQATVTVTPPPTASLSGTETICVGDSSMLTLSLTGGSSYNVTITGGPAPLVLNNVQNGATVMVTPSATTTYTISNLIAAGNTCTPIIGNSATITTNQVSFSAAISDFNGFDISCPNSTDGSITLTTTSGIPPFSVVWTGGSTGLTLTNLADGAYQVTVTDQIGCTATQVFDMVAPPELGISLASTGPSCYGESDGFITINDISGGAGPFNILLNNEPQGIAGTLPMQLDQLSSGMYTVGVEDANGCISDEVVDVPSPAQLMVDLGPDIIISFGDSLFLQASHNATNLAIFTWIPTDYLSTPLALGTWAKPPTSMRYSIYIQDEFGCEANDQISVLVSKDRRVYVPNIINPHSTLGNDIVTVWGGADVAKINYFRIFDRWGEQVFENRDFLPSDPGEGWNGTFQGRFVNPAVFVYVAEIEYIDGETEIFKGDITVVR
jgi:large repetitive protein